MLHVVIGYRCRKVFVQLWLNTEAWNLNKHTIRQRQKQEIKIERQRMLCTSVNDPVVVSKSHGKLISGHACVKQHTTRNRFRSFVVQGTLPRVSKKWPIKLPTLKYTSSLKTH